MPARQGHPGRTWPRWPAGMDPRHRTGWRTSAARMRTRPPRGRRRRRLGRPPRGRPWWRSAPTCWRRAPRARVRESPRSVSASIGSSAANRMRWVVSVPVLSLQNVSMRLIDSIALWRWASAPKPRDPDRGRRVGHGQHEGEALRHERDEHRRREHRVMRCVLGLGQDAERHDQGRQHDEGAHGHEGAGDVGLERRLEVVVALGLGEDPVRERVGADRLHLVAGRSAQDRAAREHLVTDPLLDRVGLTGECRLVDRGPRLADDPPVELDLVPPIGDDDVAHHEFAREDSMLDPVADDERGRLRQERHPVELPLGTRSLHDADGDVPEDRQAGQRGFDICPEADQHDRHEQQGPVDERVAVVARDLPVRPTRRGSVLVSLAGRAAGLDLHGREARNRVRRTRRSQVGHRQMGHLNKDVDGPAVSSNASARGALAVVALDGLRVDYGNGRQA